MRFLLAAFLVLAPVIAKAQAVILESTAPPKVGMTVREEMNMRLESGTFTLAINGLNVSGAANAHTHDLVERTFTGPEQQKVEVLDSARGFHFAFGAGNEAANNDEPGHLLNKKLLGSKTAGKWIFTLASKQKPDSAEATALRQFAGYTEAVERFSHLYGTTPRKVGDTWKPDLGPLKEAPVPIDADLECKLEDLKQVDGDQIATISIKGHLFATINDNGKLQVAINALIHRSLRDMLDLDTAINGNLKYHGAFGKAKEGQKGGTEADIEAPATLTRTVKVEKK